MTDAKTAWLDSQKMPTKRYYQLWFEEFEQFTGMTADQILADAKTRQNSGYWESKIVEFKSWLVPQKKIRDNSATSTAMWVRGFFAFHRIPLQFRTSKKKRLSEKSRLTEDYYFSLSRY